MTYHLSKIYFPNFRESGLVSSWLVLGKEGEDRTVVIAQRADDAPKEEIEKWKERMVDLWESLTG